MYRKQYATNLNKDEHNVFSWNVALIENLFGIAYSDHNLQTTDNTTIYKQQTIDLTTDTNNRQNNDLKQQTARSTNNRQHNDLQTTDNTMIYKQQTTQ